MTEPRRRYTKRQKATAVIAAEMSSQTQAAEQLGIPLTTVNGWMSEPWAVELRTKTREDLGEETRVLAHRVLSAIEGKLGDFEPRDLAILYGVLIDKSQLLTGAATARTETKALTDGLDDHEKQLLRDAIDAALLASAEGAGEPAG